MMNFVYCLTHNKYRKEASRSISSLRKFHAEKEIYLYTQLNIQKDIRKQVNVVRPKNIHKGFLDKINAIINAPKPCLYLDTDTFVLEPLDHLSEILDYYSMAGVRAPIRYSRTDVDVPDWFPEINGGVLLFADNEVASEIIEKWKRMQLKEEEDENAHVFRNMTNDQSSLRKAVFEHIKDVYILPEEYNLRCNYPFIINGNSTPKVIHARGGDLKKGIKEASKKTFTPRGFTRKEDNLKKKNYIYKLYRKVKRLLIKLSKK